MSTSGQAAIAPDSKHRNALPFLTPRFAASVRQVAVGYGRFFAGNRKPGRPYLPPTKTVGAATPWFWRS